MTLHDRNLGIKSPPEPGNWDRLQDAILRLVPPDLYDRIAWREKFMTDQEARFTCSAAQFTVEFRIFAADDKTLRVCFHRQVDGWKLGSGGTDERPWRVVHTPPSMFDAPRAFHFKSYVEALIDMGKPC